MTIAVCDTGPLTHLWQIDLAVLFSTFEALHIPTQVVQEVQGHVPLDRLPSLADCQVHVHSVSESEILALQECLSPRLTALEPADLATLALAQRLQPDLVLTDDLALRRAVEAIGLTPMGSVGILLRGYKRGLLDAEGLEQAIDKLFVHSTLYLSPRFKSYVRRLVADVLQRGRT